MRIGQIVAGRYRLEQRIGAGGMGEVWRAGDVELGRSVALKRATTGKTDDREIRREAKIVAGLRHPHVVTLHDVVTDPDGTWLVMEYLPSSNLAEMIRREGPRTPESVVTMGTQLAGALAAVHANGVLHRDIKPDNVLITEDGSVKLTDFGVSRIWGDPTLTDSGLVGGTPGYLAQEVANGEEPTTASDVFSLGATLYAAVEGEPPYGRHDNPLAVLRRAASGETRPPRRAGPLTPLLSDLLDPDPQRRPDAVTVRERLLGLAGLPMDSAAAAPQVRRRSWWRRPSVLVSVLVAGAVLVPATVVAYSTLSSPDGPDERGSSSGELRLGEPRSADPCGLLDAAKFAEYGDAELDADYGNFNRCDVLIEPESGGEVDVELDFETADDATPDGKPTQIGAVRVYREPGEDGECVRTLLLPDRHRVGITAKRHDPGPTDLCAVAETAADHALAVLAAGAVPRRTEPLPATSLATQRACALLDANALSLIPGVDAAEPDVGFGDWSCRWYSTTKELSVKLTYDRSQPLTADDGDIRAFSGRTAFVEPEADGEGTCAVRLVHRIYTNPDGRPMAELVLTHVAGPGSTAKLCDLGADLTAAIAAALPPP